MSVVRSRPEEIVAVARELLESEGPDGLSMRRIAGRLGITAGAPVLVGDEVAYTADGTPVLIGHNKYRGDAYRFEADLFRRA